MIDKKVNLKARYLFYLSSVLHASEEIRKLLKQNHVVCDRYILSTLCYHRAANQNLNFIDENQLDILQPDFTFFLKASYKIRMSRIVEREKIDLEKAMNDYLHNETFQKKVENEYFKYDNLITVDSSELSAAEVANKINTDFLAS
jgi:thymidylate kinase